MASDVQQKKRGEWTSRAGFVLAASGSAIGLGNIWKFPYMTGEHGGGAFVLVYLGCVVIVGLPLMLAELMIGRRTKLNPVGAFQKLHHKGSLWTLTGWLGIASGFLILSFYSVIAGWSLAYIFKSMAGFSGTTESIQAQFGALAGDTGTTIMWHTIFMILTIGIVIGGVKNGIERWSKILMPALLALLVGLMGYGLFATNGGAAAMKFLFYPDFSKLSAVGVLSALGHAFFTLSLGMGAMITYGSYMRSDESLIRDAVTVSFLDTLIALMAGVAIFSLVFHYGMEPSQGPGLIFRTLPVLFAETGPWISVPFFLLLSFAALTSAISLLEVVVAYFVDQRGWSRTTATLTMGSIIYLIGMLAADSTIKFAFGDGEYTFLDLADLATTNYMLPIGGFLTGLFVAYAMRDKDRVDEFGSDGPLYRALIFCLKTVTPIAVFLVILHGLELLPFMDYTK